MEECILFNICSSKLFYTSLSRHHVLKKKTKSRKAGKRKKKDELKIYLVFSGFIIILMLVLFISLFIRNKGRSDSIVFDFRDNFVRLHGVAVEKSETGKFIVRNFEDMPADCILTIRKDNSEYKEYSGIIMPTSFRAISGISPGSEVSADCTWNSSINATGCENSTFFICSAVRRNPRLEQCLGNDITYQHFCVALISHNSTYCSPILDETGRIHCYAYIDKNPGLCDNLTDGRDWCYQDLAMNWGRSDLCSMIADGSKRAACLAVVDKDVQECSNLDEDSRMTCIVQLADMLHDSSLCELTTDKEACYREIGIQ